jgi:hypothetical protein
MMLYVFLQINVSRDGFDVIDQVQFDNDDLLGHSFLYLDNYSTSDCNGLTY